jgi:DHA2 family multidrug resistance protein-like MFS transporter
MRAEGVVAPRATRRETGGEFGIAVGIATLGSLGSLVYRAQLADTVAAGVPAGAAASARESIAAAVLTAGRLPGQPGADLLETARAAFTTGLNAVAGVGAVLFVGLAVVSAVVLRRGTAGTDAAAAEATAPVPA